MPLFFKKISSLFLISILLGNIMPIAYADLVLPPPQNLPLGALDDLIDYLPKLINDLTELGEFSAAAEYNRYLFHLEKYKATGVFCMEELAPSTVSLFDRALDIIKRALASGNPDRIRDAKTAAEILNDFTKLPDYLEKAVRESGFDELLDDPAFIEPNDVSALKRAKAAREAVTEVKQLAEQLTGSARQAASEVLEELPTTPSTTIAEGAAKVSPVSPTKVLTPAEQAAVASEADEAIRRVAAGRASGATRTATAAIEAEAAQRGAAKVAAGASHALGLATGALDLAGTAIQAATLEIKEQTTRAEELGNELRDIGRANNELNKSITASHEAIGAVNDRTRSLVSERDAAFENLEAANQAGNDSLAENLARTIARIESEIDALTNQKNELEKSLENVGKKQKELQDAYDRVRGELFGSEAGSAELYQKNPARPSSGGRSVAANFSINFSNHGFVLTGSTRRCPPVITTALGGGYKKYRMNLTASTANLKDMELRIADGFFPGPNYETLYVGDLVRGQRVTVDVWALPNARPILMVNYIKNNQPQIFIRENLKSTLRTVGTPRLAAPTATTPRTIQPTRPTVPTTPTQPATSPQPIQQSQPTPATLY